MAADVGLIVGSGFGRLDLAVAERLTVTTPYGAPSSPMMIVECASRRLPCVARHGHPHAIAPHEVNYRANVWALHEQGVRRLVAVNIVGAIERALEPGALAVPEQLIDYTWGRDGTFGGGGRPVLHVDLGTPFDPALRAGLHAAIAGCGWRARGGVYGVTQGPRLETAAEIDRLERDGCTMVGMTAMPEAALARELNISYAVVALAVNWAAGRGPSASIQAQLEQHLASGMQRIAAVLERLIDAPCSDAV